MKPETLKANKTDVGRRQTLGHPRSINPNMINAVAKQSPLISQVIYVLSVHEAMKISYSHHLACQGSRNSQKSDVSNHSVVCWHGSVAFPILPIDIENLSRLSKCTLPIIARPKGMPPKAARPKEGLFRLHASWIYLSYAGFDCLAAILCH